MTRINIYSSPSQEDLEQGERPTLEGWFDLESAESWDEGTRWDGSNHISLATGGQWEHERLYRTAGGRWVLNHWSQWQGTQETYLFVGADDVRDWLLRCEYDSAAVETITGAEIEPERGPGQPQIGTPIKATIASDDLAAIDAAIERGEYRSRSEAVRLLVAEGLTPIHGRTADQP
jgi:hypothetical protein